MSDRINMGWAAWRQTRAAHRLQNSRIWDHMRLHAINATAIAALRPRHRAWWHGTSWSRIAAQYRRSGGMEDQGRDLYLAYDRHMTLNYIHKAEEDDDDFPVICELTTELETFPFPRLACESVRPRVNSAGRSLVPILRVYEPGERFFKALYGAPGPLRSAKECFLEAWKAATR